MNKTFESSMATRLDRPDQEMEEVSKPEEDDSLSLELEDEREETKLEEGEERDSEEEGGREEMVVNVMVVEEKAEGEDEKLDFRDCHSEFFFSSGDQQFNKEKGFNEPTRRADCKATNLKKSALAAVVVAAVDADAHVVSVTVYEILCCSIP